MLDHNQNLIEKINQQIDNMLPLSIELKRKVGGRHGEQLSKKIDQAVVMLQETRLKLEEL